VFLGEEEVMGIPAGDRDYGRSAKEAEALRMGFDHVRQPRQTGSSRAIGGDSYCTGGTASSVPQLRIDECQGASPTAGWPQAAEAAQCE